MKITVINFKGGCGKTSISLNIALDKDYAIVTNDLFSPIDKVLPAESVLKLEPGADMPQFPPDYDLIFDLGGHIDRRAVSALKQSDTVIIPVLYDYVDLQVSIEAIAEIQPHNGNIIIIANRTTRGDLVEVQKVIGKFYKHPVLELKQSRALSYIFTEKKSVQGMVNEGGLKAYNYGAVAEQFETLYQHIGA